MITDSDVAIPAATRPSARPDEGARVASAAVPPDGRGSHRLGIGLRLAAVSVFSGLIGFNAWWYWRDTRPVADLPTIERWIGRRQHAEAEAALRERLRRSPHDGEARMMLARALAARGDLSGCARQLQQVPYWHPQKLDARYREAQADLMNGRARDAEAALLAIINADPLHPPSAGLAHDASQELLKIYATEDRWEDAFGVLWTAYDRAAPSDRPVLLSMRLRCELQRVAPAESIKELRRYVAADPQDWDARRSLANAELALGRGAEALRDMEACLEGRPDDPRTWRDYLTMLQSLGKQEAFEAALARVPKSAEEEPMIWVFRGQARERAGDWAGAAADYHRSLDRNPNLLNARYRLAMIEERLGHREQATAHRKRWQELTDARGKLAQAYSDYYATIDAPGPALRSAVDRLAAICETLGWLRLAEGWKQYAATLQAGA